MKQKLLTIFNFVKTKAEPIAAKLYSASPFVAGILVGYFGHGVIKAGVEMAFSAVKLLFKI